MDSSVPVEESMPVTEPVVVPSACPLDCPDHCSLDVTVEDGKVVRIEGSERSTVTNGFICSKVRRFDRRLYGEHRLLHPAVRTGAKGEGSFRDVSWDEALDHIAERMSDVRHRHGAEAVLPFAYGGSNGYLSQGNADERLFRRFGAARLDHTVCAAATTRAVEGLYGRMPGIPYEEFPEARLIVVWGANPSTSGIHLVPFVREAKARGARLVVIDPCRIPLAKQADLHLPVRPGTDLVVALAVHRWLFENGAADEAFLARAATGVEELRRRCAPWTFEHAGAKAGIDPADLEAFARLFAESSPAVVRCGWGPERNRNGCSAIAAILALPAVAGKFGVRGGGYMQSNSSAWRYDSEVMVGAAPTTTRRLNMNRLGRHLVDEPDATKLLFVYNANPLATLPRHDLVRAGLEREDLFTVVFDQVLTDTARYADVVLPATTFFEHHELQRGYGSLSLMEAHPAIEPVGEARSNHAVFVDLGRRLGLARDDDPADTASLAKRLLDQDARGGDALAADLGGGGVVPPADHGAIAFVDRFPGTPDGKVHLVPEALDAEADGGLYHYREDPGTARYPLALISPATRRTVSSTLGELHREIVAVELHPGDAVPRGIASGDDVRLWNEFGEVRCRAAVRDDVRPGVASLPKGIWCHNTENGVPGTALVPDTYTDVAGGACFNDARVEVEKVGGAG